MKVLLVLLLMIGMVPAGQADVRKTTPPTPVSLSDTSRLSEAAQDGTGRVWALVTGGAGLSWWNGRHWQLAPTPSGVTGWPQALVATPGGAVACVWYVDNKHVIVTAHRGDFVRLVARVQDAPTIGYTDDGQAPATVFADRQNLWLASASGNFVRVDLLPDHTGQTERVWHVDPSQYYPDYQKDAANGTSPLYAPLAAVLDPVGHLWFWGDASDGMDGTATLRGVLIWDGHRINAMPTIPGLPDKRITCIAARDSRHLWICVRGKGIYTLDLGTMEATFLMEPTPGAFQDVQKMFSVGNDWYMIAGKPYRSYATPDNPAALSGTLWRCRAGTWQRLLPGLDRQSGVRSVAQRPVLATPEGVWIGAYGGGAWLLPPGNSPPRHLDWRVGYGLSSTDRLFAVPPAGGGVVGVELFNNNSPAYLTQTHLEQIAVRRPTDAASTLVTGRPLVQDARRHLWNVVAPPAGTLSGGTLNEWDGARWIAHPLPPEANATALSYITLDSQGRLWLIIWQGVRGGPERKTFIYDPATDHWQSFTDQKAMLVAEAQRLRSLQSRTGEPPNFFLAVMNSESLGPLAVFGSDGRVCYSSNSVMYLFDGETWHEWRRPDILHDHGFAFDGPPFFAHNGQFAVNINIFNGGPQDTPRKATDPKVTWYWSTSLGWHQGPYERGPGDDFAPGDPQPVRPVLPPGSPPPDDMLVQDANGAVWFTSGHVLYKAVGDRVQPVFTPGTPTPFEDGRRVVSALADPVGNMFVETDADRHREYVIIRASQTLAQ